MFVVAGHVVIAAPLVFPPALPPAQHGLRSVAARPDCGRGAVPPAAPAGRGRILHHSFGAGYAQRPQGTSYDQCCGAVRYPVHFGSDSGSSLDEKENILNAILFLRSNIH